MGFKPFTPPGGAPRFALSALWVVVVPTLEFMAKLRPSLSYILPHETSLLHPGVCQPVFRVFLRGSCCICSCILGVLVGEAISGLFYHQLEPDSIVLRKSEQ